MSESSKYALTYLPDTSGKITKISPKVPPTLIEPWVVWEYTACLFTNGIKFTTENLHDAIKAHADNQNLPINVFYSPDARWIIEGAFGRAKVDDEVRPRISANIRNSRHSDMQFITGIDYFGECWANFQMMIVVQPEILEKPPKPIIPSPLLPTEALVVLVVIAAGLIFSGNPGLQVLGFVGLIGGLIIWAISNKNVRDAKERYDKWKDEVAQLELEEAELKRNRLSRSFKYDDLFVFHEVMSKITASVISLGLLKQGAKVEETTQHTYIEKVIAKSDKNIFDDF